MRASFYTAQIAASGDTAAIAAPGSGKEIRLLRVQVQLEAATATTVILKAGSTAFWRFLGQNQGDGFVLDLDKLPPDIRTGLGDNAAFNVNLSGANAVGVSAMYVIDALQS